MASSSLPPLLKDAIYVLSGFGATFGLFLFSPYTYCPVDGPSMRPTLNPEPRDPEEAANASRDYVLVRRLSKPAEQLERHRGAVVVLRSPVYAKHLLVKRLTAAPGDSIVPLSHPYAKVKRTEAVDVGEGGCWVESDAGFGFADSNSFGRVSADSVVGVAAAVIWPPSRFLSSLAAPPECQRDREARLTRSSGGGSLPLRAGPPTDSSP